MPTFAEGGTVTIRPVREEDLPVFFEHLGDERARYQAGFVPTEATDREAFVARWRRMLADPSALARTLVWNERAVGHLVLFDLEGQRSVGYWVGREYWGHGVATHGLRAFLDEVSERPLYARVVEDNRASIGVLERNGFRKIGENRVFATARAAEVREWIFERIDP